MSTRIRIYGKQLNEDCAVVFNPEVRFDDVVQAVQVAFPTSLLGKSMYDELMKDEDFKLECALGMPRESTMLKVFDRVYQKVKSKDWMSTVGVTKKEGSKKTTFTFDNFHILGHVYIYYK